MKPSIYLTKSAKCFPILRDTEQHLQMYKSQYWSLIPFLSILDKFFAIFFPSRCWFWLTTKFDVIFYNLTLFHNYVG